MSLEDLAPELLLVQQRIKETKDAIEAERDSRRLSLGVLWAALALAVLALVLVRLGDLSEQRREAQRKVDIDYSVCLRGNDVRQVVRDLVVDAEAGATLDLGPLVRDDAPPWFRQFVADLRDLSAAGPSLQDRTFPRLGLRDCDAEYPDHS